MQWGHADQATSVLFYLLVRASYLGKNKTIRTCRSRFARVILERRFHPGPRPVEGAPVDGWYVDDRCTNCDVARQLAPDLIDEENGTSRIVRQPETEEENRRLHAAVFACHTRSIRPTTGQPDQALDPFPMALDDGVLLCGHNSPHTAAANAYLLRRPDGTQMMIDTPAGAAPSPTGTRPSAGSPTSCSPIATTPPTAAAGPTTSAPGCGSMRATSTPRPTRTG